MITIDDPNLGKKIHTVIMKSLAIELTKRLWFKQYTL
jgi:hypothetical protein